MTLFPTNWVDNTGQWWNAATANLVGQCINERYIRPATGIPASDLTVSMQAQLSGLSVQRLPEPTGSAADATNFQNAVNALPAKGGIIACGSGTYDLTSAPPNFGTKRVHVHGVGGWAMDPFSNGTTVLLFTAANQSGLVFHTDGCRVSDLVVAGLGASTSGAGIVSTASTHFGIDGCYVYGFYDGVSINGGTYGHMIHNFVRGQQRYGLFTQNTTTPDAGDFFLTNNVFDMNGETHDAVSAIRWQSGGGICMRGNKINGNGTGTGRWATGVDIAFDGALPSDTADIFVQNNSIENCSATGVSFSRTAGTHVIYGCHIQANEIASCPTGVSVGPDYRIFRIEHNVFANVTTGIDVLADAGYGLQIGANSYGVPCTRCVRVAADNYQNVVITPQDRNGDGIVYDNGTNAATGTILGGAQFDNRYLRAVDFNTSATAAALWTLGVPNFGGGRFQIELAGVENGVGGFSHTKEWRYTVDGSGVVTLNTPVETKFPASGTNQALTATTSANIIAVKVNTAGNLLVGAVAKLDVHGVLSQLRRGA